MPISKRFVINSILRQLIKTLETQKHDYKQALDTSIKAEGKMQSRHDTTKEDFARLAESHKNAISLTKQTIEHFETLKARFENPKDSKTTVIGKLVTLRGREGIDHYFISEKGGGLKVKTPENGVSILTVTSPLGKALLGHSVNETIQLETSSGSSSFKIIEVV